MKQIVILGGGFAGVKAALKLSRYPDFSIQLISDRTYFQYYPALYRSATGRSHIESALPLADIFKNKENVEIIIDKAVAINPKAKTVHTKRAKAYPYDELIVALGSVTNYFGIKGLRRYSYGIKSLNEAVEFKDHLHQELTDEHRPDLNYVIVGGGPTGIELAGALSFYLRQIMGWHKISARNISIDLVEAAPKLLPRSKDSISEAVTEHLKLLGVKVMCGETVQAETYNKLMANGEAIKTKTVIWTAGVANNPFFANNPSSFKLSDHGKVTVDHYLKVRPHIYVLGDNADTKYSGMAQTALHDAKFVSQNLIRHERGQAPLIYSAKRPISIIPVGVKWATVEWGPFHFKGYPAWILRKLADLVAYLEIEPFGRAVKIWLADNHTEEDCPICDKQVTPKLVAK